MIKLLVVTLALAFSYAWAVDSPVVRTYSGLIRGKLIPYRRDRTKDVYEFRTIPFAKPPLGEYRFKKPDPVQPWSNVLDATKMTPACIQFDDGEEIDDGTPETEDCLYLNIWVPKATLDAAVTNPYAEKLAVYIYLHGGGYIGGTITNDLYDGSVLAGQQRILVVTMQYRLGPFGFLFFGRNSAAPGNAGLWDQLEGMKWVKNNIAAFGGDPNAITIGGESAGGSSASLHQLSPQSRGYFNRAIVQSGTGLSFWSNQDINEALKLTDQVINALAPRKCPGVTTRSSAAEKLRCLQSGTITPSDMVAAYKKMDCEPLPLVDGIFIPMEPKDALAAGAFTKVPLLIGFTHEEGSSWFEDSEAERIFKGKNALGLNDYHQLTGIAIDVSIEETAHANEIEAHYRPMVPNRKNIVGAAIAIAGDYALTCPTYLWAEAVAQVYRRERINYGVYVYDFNQPVDGEDWEGSYHSLELVFIFGDPIDADEDDYTEDMQHLSKAMMGYWGNFIKTGNPGQVKATYSGCEGTRNPRETNEMRPWPTFDADSSCPKQVIDLSIASIVYTGCSRHMKCNYKADDCWFWRRIGEV